MFRSLNLWVEKYLYRPGYFEICLSLLLFPLAVLYSVFVVIFTKFSAKFRPEIPVISVGNLVLGGSGKTPLTKAIYKEFANKNTFIVLRGYKRVSKGLIKVAVRGEILCDVFQSGDEAMEYALSLEGVNVIVSENRVLAIKEAIKMGAELVILDDGFSKFGIEKFDILLKPSPRPVLNLPLPSGAYRYPLGFYKFANFVPQKDDIIHTSKIENPAQNMVLVTAIAKPYRLKDYAKICLGFEVFPDHYSFKKSELEEILAKYKADTLLVTMKDYAKIKDFDLPLSIIKLDTEISPKFRDLLVDFVKNYKGKKC